jgi:hypothetical protein
MPESSSADSSMVVDATTMLAALSLRQFVLDSGGNTTLLVVRLTATMPPDDRERFHRRHGSKNALKQQRLADRRDAIRDLVSHYDLTSGHQLSAMIECDLAEVAFVEADVTTAIDKPKAAALRHVLDLSRGKPPSFETIRKALAGLGKT